VKTISAELLAHKRQQVTTTCQLMLVTCTDGTVYGFTDLDVNVSYDDGDGYVTYEASQGFMPSAISAEGALSVENADLSGLIAYVDTGITPDVVRSGKLDYADLRLYLVNYEDLTMGHEWVGAGTLGEVTYNDGVFTSEYRSRAQVLKQNLCQLYSLTCRAQYGDARCGKALEWFTGTVTAPGPDVLSQFRSDDLTQGEGYFKPGLVEWLTGRNAPRKIEVTEFVEGDSSSGGTVTLLFPVYYPIQAGDTFRIRIDCPKTPDACKDPRRWGPGEWANHYRGEPQIPIADDVSVPGANT
jgi:uncharacterized phage protein (TIGR02218 family)